MRTLFAALSFAALAGCGEAPAPSAEASGMAVTGFFRAASVTAQERTGDVRVERGGLVFHSGVILYTRALEPRRGDDLISADGDTFAAAAFGASDLRVELRRVTEQTIAEGGQGVCGDRSVGYIALVHDTRATTLTLLVFAGNEPPGPRATESRVCARLGFSAPEGARTREGIVL